MEKEIDVEELLKPRYKVVADFPQGVFKFQVGEILEKKGIHFTGQAKSINENEIDKYPHLFKKLEWWEDRKESDMPEYLKVNTEKTSLFIGDLHKVRELHLFPDPETLNINASKHYVLLEDKSNFYRFNLSHFIPATKEEYENQNNVTK